MSKKTNYFDRQEVLLGDLNHDQEGRIESHRNSIRDHWSNGIISDPNGLSNLAVTIDGTTATLLNVSHGSAYANGRRLSISSNKTFGSSEPFATTDGICTPQSTGNRAIPLVDYTNQTWNHIWLEYLNKVNTSPFTLDPITGDKKFPEEDDGYRVYVSTDNYPGNPEGITDSVYLGSVKALGASVTLESGPTGLTSIQVPFSLPKCFSSEIGLTHFIKGQHLYDDSISREKLKEGIIGSDQISDDAITTPKILDDAVTTPKILDLNVTTNKLNTDAVVTSKILDLNVTTNKLNTDAVTTVKITDLNVTRPKLSTALDILIPRNVGLAKNLFGGGTFVTLDNVHTDTEFYSFGTVQGLTNSSHSLAISPTATNQVKIWLAPGYGITSGGSTGAVSAVTEKFDDTANTQTAQTSLNTAREALSGCSYQGYGLTFQGSTGTDSKVTERYDDIGDTQLARLDHPVDRQMGAAFSVYNLQYNVYGLDGASNDSRLYRFDDIANTHSLMCNLSTGRAGGSGFAFNGYGFIQGGVPTLSSVRVDMPTGTYLARVALITQRWALAAFAFNDYGFTSGGDKGSAAADVERFDDTANTQMVRTDLGFETEGCTGYAFNNYGFTSGGDTGGVTGNTLRYDDTADTHMARTVLNTPRTLATGYSVPTYNVNYMTVGA